MIPTARRVHPPRQSKAHRATPRNPTTRRSKGIGPPRRAVPESHSVAALLLMLPLSFGFRIRKGHALGRWHRSATFVGTLWTSFKFLWWRKLVSKETPLDDPR